MRNLKLTKIILITFTLRHLKFGHMADILCVLFMECMSQAIVDELSLSARMSLRAPSNVSQSTGAHGECRSVNLKLCPDFK